MDQDYKALCLKQAVEITVAYAGSTKNMGSLASNLNELYLKLKELREDANKKDEGD